MFAGHHQPSLKYLTDYDRTWLDMMWHELGIELLDSNDVGELDTIKAMYQSDRNKCIEMFDLWLKKRPTASWNQLIEALRQPGTKLGKLANKIEQILLRPRPQG